MEATDGQRLAFGQAVDSLLIDRRRKVSDVARGLHIEHETLRGWIRGPGGAPPKSEAPRSVVFALERELGAEPGTLSRCLGYLPVNAVPAVTVEEAIRADVELDQRAQRSLIASYRSFVASRRGESTSSNGA